MPVVGAGVLFFASACLKDWCLFRCEPCEIDRGACQCVPNPDYGCPPGTVHGTYNYGGWFYPKCQCNCEQGWTGYLCDQRDTSYFFSFRHGSDTTALAGIKTGHTIRGLRGVFPANSPIDTIRIGGLPFMWEKGTFRLCGWGCPYIEITFPGGETAASLTGILTIDSADNSFAHRYVQGTFSSNLYVQGSGQIYYVRDGHFTLF